MNENFRPIFLLFLLLMAGGCHRNPPPRPAADFARDAAMETKVRALLSADPDLKNEAIDVNVAGGEIFLKGKVHREKQKEKATEVAIRAGGSAPVKNELVVEG